MKSIAWYTQMQPNLLLLKYFLSIGDFDKYILQLDSIEVGILKWSDSHHVKDSAYFPPVSFVNILQNGLQPVISLVKKCFTISDRDCVYIAA